MSRPVDCLVIGCPGRMAGQLIVCAPHWWYLSEDLRLEVVRVGNAYDAQRAVGNLRRATRNEWKALVPKVAAELEAAHAALESDLGSPVAAAGLDWHRAVVAIAERRKAEADLAEAVPDA